MNTRLTQAQIDDMCAKRPVRAAEGGCIMTGPVRLSFPTLTPEAKAKAKSKSVLANPPDKYSAALLFPHKNIGPLMEALRAAVRQHYPTITDPMVLLNPLDKNAPVKDQGVKVNVSEGGREAVKKSTAGYTVGLPYINPKSGNLIPCFRAEAGRWVNILPGELETIMYGGCWVDAKLVMFKSTTSANPGVALGLQGLWKLADDNSFGGGGGAVATEGGSAGDVIGIEDPNSVGGGVVPQTSAAPPSTDWG